MREHAEQRVGPVAVAGVAGMEPVGGNGLEAAQAGKPPVEYVVSEGTAAGQVDHSPGDTGSVAELDVGLADVAGRECSRPA